MRLFAPGVLLFAIVIAGCTKPAIEPTSAPAATKSVVVCWRDRPEESGDKGALREAVGSRLRSAGYNLQKNDCALGIKWTFKEDMRNGTHVYSSATLTLLDSEKKEVETMQFEIERHHVPVSEPERLATLFVNAMNASAKLADYAAARAKSASEAETDAGAGAADEADAAPPPAFDPSASETK